MDFEMPALRFEEQVSLQLRALYEKSGYDLYHMGSFEEYDLYMQNRPFLTGEDIITFTSADGRLMALKPDVTLSIVKNTRPGDVRRLYYNENVFRRSRQTGEYREIRQLGLEFIGGEGQSAEAEVLSLAAQSLALLGGSALDLSHMAFVEAILQPFTDENLRAKAVEALRSKSPHSMHAAASAAGCSADAAQKLATLTELAGPYANVLPQARALTAGNTRAAEILDMLETRCQTLAALQNAPSIRLDFSIVNDTDYYNGLIFQGYVSGVSTLVLAGGRYDNLLGRFGNPQGAVGFAVYLDTIVLEQANGKGKAAQAQFPWLNVALPKGRLGDQVYALFERAGLSSGVLFNENRKLVFEDTQNRMRFFLVKPSDVDIYVEHGAADIGIVGRDVLLESGADVMELLDLGIGACRIAVAGPPHFKEDPARPLRVATKYPSVARRYYAAQSRAVELIKLHGSIELAPLLGLSDVIVDIVETGATLRENNLAVLADVVPSSARLIVNRASWRFKEEQIQRVTERLGEALC